jgi:hypothetical protein
MIVLFGPLNRISFVHSEIRIQFNKPHDALSSALCFCDQRRTTEREKIHLQQSQETSNVISERLVFY